ncbi:MAG: superoxide dismutase [Acidimicrobiia bacterium]|nr:superoxide dismutase [Acidimicrobiia bacterium]
MRRLTIALAAMLLLGTAAPAAAKTAFPEVIQLPTAFEAEGITIGARTTFYAGSLADGTIVEGNLRTGDVEVFVEGTPGQIAVGMSYDKRSGYLFVAGGPFGEARVYDTKTGDLVASYAMQSGGAFGDFINDVIVTRTGAYFTNSFAAEIYRIPLGAGGNLLSSTAEAIPLSGDWVQIDGPFVFNANGIEANPKGDTLLVVSSAGSALYTVDAYSGVASQVDLGGPLAFGDGLALAGKTLYVVQNQLNQIGVIDLHPSMNSGVVGDPITSPFFNVPTTAAVFGSALYAVNAKFGTPPEGTPYEVVRVDRR